MTTKPDPHNPKLAPSPRGRPGKPEPVRLAAVRACLEFDTGGPLREEPPKQLRKEEDQRLFLQLVRGVVRHRRSLESHLEALAGKPLRRLDRELVWAALLGLYQLRFLDRIPPHAAVYETVALAAPLGRGRGKGWLNAVLRRAQREGEGKGDEAGWQLDSQPLAVRASFPDWMVERWRKRYGDQATERMCEAGNHPGGLTLRVETGRISPGELLEKLAGEDIAARPHPLWRDAVMVEHARAGLRSRPFAEGLCYAQDVSSQVLMAWCRPIFRGWVVDACAAPGGKLTLLAGQRETGLRLVGMETSAGRLKRISENLDRLRLPATNLLRADGRRLPFAPDAPLNGLLLDVPCTATGIIRKYPEVKWRRKPADVVRQAALQRELLEEAARAVMPGGWVLYITCSLEPEENEQNVGSFLAARPDFARRSFRELPPPEGLGEAPGGFITPEGDFQCLPADDRTGLYAALLVKQG